RRSSDLLKFFEWRIALVTKDKFIVGRAFKAQVVIYDEFDKIGPLEKDLYQIVKDNKDFRAFSYFSSIYRYEITKIDESRIEVRYIDLRYLKNGHYPFVCILILNKDTKQLNLVLQVGYFLKKNFNKRYLKIMIPL